MEKLVNGVSMLIKRTDFEYGKLSQRANEIHFKSFALRTFGKATRDETTAFVVNVTIINGTEVYDTDVRVTNTPENEMVLNSLKIWDSVDFEIVVISHRAQASNNFGTLVQTIRCEKITKPGAPTPPNKG